MRFPSLCKCRSWLAALLLLSASFAAWRGFALWQHHRHISRIVDVRILEDTNTTPLDLIADHSSICEVHGVQMEVATVPVIYGALERPVSSSFEERATPHAYRTAAGGCIVRAAHEARVFVCPECVRQATEMRLSLAQPAPSALLPAPDLPRLP